MEYKIIKTGSAGNALLLDGRILIDCGVLFKDIEPYADGIEVVALTHEHGDHFNKATIKRLAYEYPGIRFCVPRHMITKLAEPGLFVDKKRVDVALPRMTLSFIFSSTLLLKYLPTILRKSPYKSSILLKH